MTRNSSHFQKLPETAHKVHGKIDTEGEAEVGTHRVSLPYPEVEYPLTPSISYETNNNPTPPTQRQQDQRKTYPRRHHHPPEEWKNY